MGSFHSEPAQPIAPVPGRMRMLLAAVLVPLVLVTALGAYLLWPDSRKHATPEGLGAPAALVNGTVTNATRQSCVNDPSNNQCVSVALDLTSGADKGTSTQIELPIGPGLPDVQTGDKMVLGRTVDALGTPDYYFSDFQRKPQLAWLAAAFCVLVVLVARWRGIGALVGLVITWLVITQFMLPSIFEGRSPLLVALTGSSVIVLLALYVAHGFNARTTTAVIGTLASLGITGVLAGFAVDLVNLTGMGTEESTYVQSYAAGIDLQGLILGGIVLGGLGILNDMTVTQSSAVREVHMAQPNLNRRQLYTSGMRVGRDHIASTVYTLALAYTGAALPLLVLFTVANRQFADVVGSEMISEEIVRTLVGSFGLILSVPITTGLAAVVEKSRNQVVVEPDDHLVPAVGDFEAPIAPAVVAETPPPSEFSEENPTLVEDLVAPPPLPPKVKRRFWRRRNPGFSRPIGRRERKFWEDD